VNSTRLSERYLEHFRFTEKYKENGLYPYYRAIQQSSGSEVVVGGKKMIMVSSNDYLGLTHDKRVIEKTSEMLNYFGTGAGGSRLLCGNLELHEQLERELAEFVGKKHALVFPSGFTTNLGSISTLLTNKDIILYDRENHASIFDACKLSKAQIVPFARDNVQNALQKLQNTQYEEDGIVLLITEGVFSMSGSIVDLPSFIDLKKQIPHLYVYLDDAHGIGTMGKSGRGVAAHYNLQDGVDFIMGTFSKSLGSIGGFISLNDDYIAEHLQHTTRTMIFSAALPAGNVATVLAALQIIKNEPERIVKLKENISLVRKGYRDIGLDVEDTTSPIVPIDIGNEDKAMLISRELFDNDIFALPVIFPAVPRRKAIIRTSFMSTHTKEQLEYFLLTLRSVLEKHGIPN
jgi:8-amino-7-oxononanoate synthase